MSIQFPSHEEIQAAFKGGEADVVALFDKVGRQIVELAEQLAKQAEIRDMFCRWGRMNSPLQMPKLFHAPYQSSKIRRIAYEFQTKNL